MISGCGIYKNMGVCDGFLCVQHNGRQYNVRVSRPLSDLIVPEVGPLAVEVLVPFRTLLLSLAPGQYPVSADLRWTAAFPAYLEAPHRDVLEGRVTVDSNRYDQVGSWSGWIELDGKRFESEHWWGVRDHSWGVRRDVGGFDSPYGYATSSMLWLWAHVATEEISCQFQQREDGQGQVLSLDGEVCSRLGSKDRPRRVMAVEHEISFVPGTRAWSRLTYEVVLEDGDTLTIEAQALGTAWAYRGTGYENGYDDSRGVGVPRGELVESDVLDVSHPQLVTREGEGWKPGHREQPARLTINDEPGFGHLPVMSFGRIERYDLGRPTTAASERAG